VAILPVDLPPHIDTSDQPLPGPAQPTLRPASTSRKTDRGNLRGVLASSPQPGWLAHVPDEPAGVARRRPCAAQTRSRTASSGSALASAASRALLAALKRRLLEVVVLDDDGQPVAIHPTTLRPKFYEHL